MPFMKHITQAQLDEHFVYRGWMFGCVPVYIGRLGVVAPNIATRNGVPEFCLDVAEALFAGFCCGMSFLVPTFDPSYPLAITGRLDGAPIAEGEL